MKQARLAASQLPLHKGAKISARRGIEKKIMEIAEVIIIGATGESVCLLANRRAVVKKFITAVIYVFKLSSTEDMNIPSFTSERYAPPYFSAILFTDSTPTP